MGRAGSAARNFLEALGKSGSSPLDARHIVMVVAHPDDETVGLGSQLHRLAGIRLIHVTDGAPANMADARAHGFATRKDYAAARRAELEAAMRLAGMSRAQLMSLGLVDQEASLAMVDAAERLADLFALSRIGLVITHAYEGGHPDHDATCFMVHAAVCLLRRSGAEVPAILEATGYHACPDGGLASLRFLAPDAVGETVPPFTPACLAAKRRLLDCFSTQKTVLGQLGLGPERIRPAPVYDFTRPPHDGRLWYENFDWGMTGPRWRSLAAGAAAALGLGLPLWA